MIMKEYGGYIELDNYYGNEYYADMISLNCGRNCLAYLIEARDIHKIYLPYFLCDSVMQTCMKYDVIIEYYSVDEQLKPHITNEIEEDAYLYVVNYYGQLEKEYILQLSRRYHNLIVDYVQAFFTPPLEHIDTIYSCRKYFGVPDGAYLSTDVKGTSQYPRDISYKRMQFLLGRYELEASKFYDEYVNNNNAFDMEPVKHISKLTANLLKGIDYGFVKKQREENFRYIHDKLEKKNKLLIHEVPGPFMYPLWIENGHLIRKMLKNEKIYIPILWPDVFGHCMPGSLEYQLADDILPIPIDQRYDSCDMKEMLRIIGKYI